MSTRSKKRTRPPAGAQISRSVMKKLFVQKIPNSDVSAGLEPRDPTPFVPQNSVPPLEDDTKKVQDTVDTLEKEAKIPDISSLTSSSPALIPEEPSISPSK